MQTIPTRLSRLACGLLLALLLLAGKHENRTPPALTPTLTTEQKASLAANPVQTIQLNTCSYAAEQARWRDIAGTPYPAPFRETFRYESATVTVRYLRIGPTFWGSLEAKGLKPNFAYQIKLRGNYAADPVTHRRIGYLGRWRLSKDKTNFSDRDYEKEKYCAQKNAESYLLFDWFVTDSEGNATHSFWLESSLHVLWNDILNGRSLRTDTPTRSFALPGKIAHAPRNITVWAENEGTPHNRHRPAVGKAQLPMGRYQCDIVLTEESFHQQKQKAGGYWATVLRGAVDFYVF